MKSKTPPKCDFCGCSAVDLPWVFDGPDPAAGLRTICGKAVLMHDDGLWAACEACAEDVDRQRIDSLVRRSLSHDCRSIAYRWKEVNGAPPPEWFMAALYQQGLAVKDSYIRSVVKNLGPRREMTKDERANLGRVYLAQMADDPSMN